MKKLSYSFFLVIFLHGGKSFSQNIIKLDSLQLALKQAGTDTERFNTLMMITKITSSGPVFYKQERIGENGKPFNFVKFRSMYVDEEKMGVKITTDNNPGITKWGNFMRKPLYWFFFGFIINKTKSP